MKMTKKQYTKCKHFLLFECFRINKQTSQLTKCCAKCLDNRKKLRQQTKCKHGRERSYYLFCGGGGICEHNKRRSYCLFCGESQICEHNKIKSRCLFCGGSQVCEHNKIKSYCLFCGGSQICEHNRQRSKCLSCSGGGICEHNKRISICKGCGGGQICEYNCERSKYPICDPPGHFVRVVRGHAYTALKSNKEMSSAEYLGCNIETRKRHIEQQFTEGISCKSDSEWHIDHKIPLKYNKPSLEEVAQRLHYTNTQSMWASENMSKGCQYILADFPVKSQGYQIKKNDRVY